MRIKPLCDKENPRRRNTGIQITVVVLKLSEILSQGTRLQRQTFGDRSASPRLRVSVWCHRWAPGDRAPPQRPVTCPPYTPAAAPATNPFSTLPPRDHLPSEGPLPQLLCHLLPLPSQPSGHARNWVLWQHFLLHVCFRTYSLISEVSVSTPKSETRVTITGITVNTPSAGEVTGYKQNSTV